MNKEGEWETVPRHGEPLCDAECCGTRRCRFCAHAHQEGTPCVCTCWTDCLKFMKIIPGRLSFKPNEKKAVVSSSKADFVEADEPMDDDRTASSNGSGGDDAPLWKWNERDLNENLQIVSEIIIREAKPDHEPLHDLSAHLTLWMENAAAGRYTSFFSHILVNRFCEGCCCFLETPASKEESAVANANVHTISECQKRCCGQFLCKLCLHKHGVDDDCDCDCVNSAIQALGLEVQDAEKVQESTLAKWEKMAFGRSFKREILEKRRQSEYDNW